MEKEIDLKRLFGVIKKRIWVVVICTALFTAAGVIYNTFFKEEPIPMYEASTKIIVRADAALSSTLKVVIKDSTILDKVSKELELRTSSEALGEKIFVENIGDSQVLKITVVYPNPVLAAKIANTTANVFKEEVPTILNFNNVSILSEAAVNDNPLPIDSNEVRNIAAAFLIGIMLGIGITFLLDSFDDTLRSEREIEQLLEVPVLGSISKVDKKSILKKEKEKEGLAVGGEIIDS